MSIAIGIAVPEGLVLAGDSRMTYPNPRGWPKIASDNADKVFQLSPKVGAAVFGWGMLNGRSIKSHIIDQAIAYRSAGKICIDQILSDFVQYFEGEYQAHVTAQPKEKLPPNQYAFGFLVAGYTTSGIGQVYEVLIPGHPHKAPRHTTALPGATWQGQIDIITRLILGRDPRLNIGSLPPNLQQAIKQSEYIIYFARLVLQDAIDLAIFLAQTTIQMQRFTDGIMAIPGDIAGVGGPIDVAVITREEGFRWVQKKQLRGEAAVRSSDLGSRPQLLSQPGPGSLIE